MSTFLGAKLIYLICYFCVKKSFHVPKIDKNKTPCIFIYLSKTY